MEKNVYAAELLDAYRPLLTEKQADIMSLYYEEDLSLSEIKEHYGITRQAVLDNIKRAEKQLERFESGLGLVKLIAKHRRAADEIRNLLEKVEPETAHKIEIQLRKMED